MSKEIQLAEDVVLVKDGARTWQVRFLCQKMGTWHWSPPFQASTKQAAVKNCRPHLACLVADCAQRFRVEAAELLGQHDTLKRRSERLAADANEGWE